VSVNAASTLNPSTTTDLAAVIRTNPDAPRGTVWTNIGTAAGLIIMTSLNTVPGASSRIDANLSSSVAIAGASTSEPVRSGSKRGKGSRKKKEGETKARKNTRKATAETAPSDDVRSSAAENVANNDGGDNNGDVSNEDDDWVIQSASSSDSDDNIRYLPGKNFPGSGAKKTPRGKKKSDTVVEGNVEKQSANKGKGKNSAKSANSGKKKSTSKSKNFSGDVYIDIAVGEDLTHQATGTLETSGNSASAASTSTPVSGASTAATAASTATAVSRQDSQTQNIKSRLKERLKEKERKAKESATKSKDKNVLKRPQLRRSGLLDECPPEMVDFSWLQDEGQDFSAEGTENASEDSQEDTKQPAQCICYEDEEEEYKKGFNRKLERYSDEEEQEGEQGESHSAFSHGASEENSTISSLTEALSQPFTPSTPTALSQNSQGMTPNSRTPRSQLLSPSSQIFSPSSQVSGAFSPAALNSPQLQALDLRVETVYKDSVEANLHMLGDVALRAKKARPRSSKKKE
jgi:hypothetical protein